MEESTRVIHNVRTFFTSVGEGRPLLCLHGWGRNVSQAAFDELRAALRDASVRIIAPDLPGFGKSDEPPRPWSVDDYADFVEDLVSKLQLCDVLLLGHSFGGRIAIKLAARRRPWIAHLYLCAAAGVGRSLLIRRKFWLGIAKLGNALFSLPVLQQVKPLVRKVLYRLLRVHDYHDASERMRQTMAFIVEEDLTSLLPRITMPTDLFFGTEDTLTPLRDGQIMNTKIVQSKLHVFQGTRHRVHRQRATEIAGVIRESLS